MTIRFKSGDPTGVPSGYEGVSSPNTQTIPAFGPEDTDVAFFNTFDKEISFHVGDEESGFLKVPVLFASGEKWAQMKTNKAIRDKNGTLILPIVTIVRTSLDQTYDKDIAARGINQATGKLTFRRKLDKLDRDYQNLINRIGLVNQSNVAIPKSGNSSANQIHSSEIISNLENDPSIRRGGLMLPDRTQNIWEVISVPTPQFFTATYEVTFWTQYTTHMNQMIEKFMSSLLVPGNCLRLERNGYWVVAYFENLSFSPDNNITDSAGQERIIKYKFSSTVPSYVFASQAPGVPVPIKKIVSCPSISFTTENHKESSGGALGDPSLVEPWIGADDPTLPIASGQSQRRDQRAVANPLFSRSDLPDLGDPALTVDKKGRPFRSKTQYIKKTIINPTTGKLEEMVVKITSKTAQGEEIFSIVNDPACISYELNDKLNS